MPRKQSTPRPDMPLTKQEARWEVQFAALEAYKRKYGDCLVPQNYPPKKPGEDSKKKRRSLGRWCNWQRMEYWKWRNKHRDPEDPMPERFVRLEKLGFEWDLEDARWKKRLSHFLRYRSRYGKLPPPCSPLGRWFCLQRAYYKKTWKYKDPKTGEKKPFEIRERRRALFVEKDMEGMFEPPALRDGKRKAR